MKLSQFLFNFFLLYKFVSLKMSILSYRNQKEKVERSFINHNSAILKYNKTLKCYWFTPRSRWHNLQMYYFPSECIYWLSQVGNVFVFVPVYQAYSWLLSHIWEKNVFPQDCCNELQTPTTGLGYKWDFLYVQKLKQRYNHLHRISIFMFIIPITKLYKEI